MTGALACVISNLALGGVPRVYVDVLGQLASDGFAGRTTIVAPDGPLRLEYERRGVRWEPIDWADRPLSTYQRVAELLRPGDRSVLLADPALVHVLPALAGRGPALLALHSGLPRFEHWFSSAALERFRRLVHELVGAGALGLLTIGERYAAEYAEFLAVDPAAIAVLPPAVAARAVSPSGSVARCGDTVLVVARLSPEKEPQIRAGIELVHEGLARGRACRLGVVGDGPWAGEAEALCRASLPDGTWRFHGAMHDPSSAMAGAGVVLATGITALEASAIGVPTVVVRTMPDDLGALGPVLTPATYDAVAADAFGARHEPPRTAAETWAQLDALSDDDLMEVRDLVHARNAVPAAATALLTAFDRLEPAKATPAVAALGELAADLETRLADVQRLADELWAVKVDLECRVAAG